MDTSWDDTDLVKSWASAYDEYKKYHSLALTGQTATNTAQEGAELPTNNEQNSEFTGSEDCKGATAQTQESSTLPQASNMAEAMAHLVPNEEMRAVALSWYYAGYYTGLHDGKRQVAD